MNWGYKITFLYIGFVMMIGTCVTVAMMSDFDLVEENYYEQEITYQDRINAIKRTNALKTQPSIEVIDSIWMVHLNNQQKVNSATLVLYHPQFKKEDKEWSWDNTSTHVLGKVKGVKGKRKLKIEWQSGGEEYYYEKNIFFK